MEFLPVAVTKEQTWRYPVLPDGTAHINLKTFSVEMPKGLWKTPGHPGCIQDLQSCYISGVSYCI